jgi:hypothetical protein
VVGSPRTGTLKGACRSPSSWAPSPCSRSRCSRLSVKRPIEEGSVAGFGPMVWVGYTWDADVASVLVGRADVILPNSCLIYLGQAGGFAALFDPVTDSSWLVPTDSVSIRTGGISPTSKSSPATARHAMFDADSEIRSHLAMLGPAALTELRRILEAPSTD